MEFLVAPTAKFILLHLCCRLSGLLQHERSWPIDFRVGGNGWALSWDSCTFKFFSKTVLENPTCTWKPYLSWPWLILIGSYYHKPKRLSKALAMEEAEDLRVSMAMEWRQGLGPLWSEMRMVLLVNSPNKLYLINSRNDSNCMRMDFSSACSILTLIDP